MKAKINPIAMVTETFYVLCTLWHACGRGHARLAKPASYTLVLQNAKVLTSLNFPFSLLFLCKSFIINSIN